MRGALLGRGEASETTARPPGAKLDPEPDHVPWRVHVKAIRCDSPPEPAEEGDRGRRAEASRLAETPEEAGEATSPCWSPSSG